MIIDKKLYQSQIVIADDDDAFNALIKEAFEELGYEEKAHFTKDGDELLDFLKNPESHTGIKGPFCGLVLLDLSMPRVDGFQVLERIKKDQIVRKAPVIVMSTSNVENDVNRCMELGANAFIPKPDDYDGLVRTLKSLCNFWLEVVICPRLINS